ncbi:hypothetical protein [Microbispora sp. NPDC046933]|uniref:hypothetical protein n=1 Tax=Microbispora sp. NPDC046933 TaxID=3155618 RepID=UPI0033D3CEC0
MTRASAPRASRSGSIEADYHSGVLTLRIPVLEQANPREIEIRSAGHKAINA